MNKIKWFNNLYNKYIGKIEYTITTLCVSGTVNKYTVSSLKDVENLVKDINSEKYWCVQKIKKCRKYDFKFKKDVSHIPLHFNINDVTEIDNGFSFPIKDKSLLKINRHIPNYKKNKDDGDLLKSGIH